MNSELNDVQLTALRLLRYMEAKKKADGLTLREIMEKTDFKRSRLYKNIMPLVEEKFIAKGVKSSRADSFYITDKGLKFVEIYDRE